MHSSFRKCLKFRPYILVLPFRIPRSSVGPIRTFKQPSLLRHVTRERDCTIFHTELEQGAPECLIAHEID